MSEELRVRLHETAADRCEPVAPLLSARLERNLCARHGLRALGTNIRNCSEIIARHVAVVPQILKHLPEYLSSRPLILDFDERWASSSVDRHHIRSVRESPLRAQDQQSLAGEFLPTFFLGPNPVFEFPFRPRQSHNQGLLYEPRPFPVQVFVDRSTLSIAKCSQAAVQVTRGSPRRGERDGRSRPMDAEIP